MESLKIIALSFLAAVAYGILHDQVTARVCLEYFTEAHPRIIASRDPTRLALAWGVVATWWVGLPLGLILAIASRAGSPPRRSARELIRPLLLLLGIMAALALAAGIAGFVAAQSGRASIPTPLSTRIPPGRHARFIADLWAHRMSYLSGAAGGFVLAGWVLVRRRRPPV